VYNYFRQGWLAARLQKGIDEVFGDGNSVVLTLPYRKTIEPDQPSFGDFTVFFAGATSELRNAFAGRPDYWLRDDEPPAPASVNGFQQTGNVPAAATIPQWQHFGLATILPSNETLRVATDDWPFLYLRGPMIPTQSWRGMIIMGALGLLLVLLFMPRSNQRVSEGWTDNLQFFLLGAGFMLVETKAVVVMALLFGSTWIVNSVVFFAVLVMILLANWWILRSQRESLGLYYAGLLITLVLNVIIPLDFFLGMNRGLQIIGSCVLTFAPILFAGVIFAALFKRTAQPDRAFAMNIAGAMVGGLAEYCSMLLGFQRLGLVAILFYALVAIGLWRAVNARTDEGVVAPGAAS
jgi:hypothetical protein